VVGRTVTFFPFQQTEHFKALCKTLASSFLGVMLKNPFLSANFLLSTKGRRLYTIIPKEGGIAIARNSFPSIIIIKAFKSLYFSWRNLQSKLFSISFQISLQKGNK